LNSAAREDIDIENITIETSEETMSTIRLFKQDPDTRERTMLGTITEAQLDFLAENLEEEFDEDEEYFLFQDTIEYLRDQGADDSLLSLLEEALAGSPDGADVIYLIE
jgi:hypothetical protein